MGNIDLTATPRMHSNREYREALEAIVFTSARGWKRSITIDGYVRHRLVRALKLQEVVERLAEENKQQDADG